MATSYAGAVRAGMLAAARLHRKLDLKPRIEARGGNIDVFGAIQTIDLPLLLRPLEGLLGAYLIDTAPGVLVTTQRPMSVQRFTASHELGHFTMNHLPSLDDESILRRMSLASSPDGNFQEVEADSFAVGFMMPRWLVLWHVAKQGWATGDLSEAANVYQLALRLGASYEATCWTLVRYNLISAALAGTLLKTQPRQLKASILASYYPQDYRGDVWLLTERDADTEISGSRNDIFVLRLEEQCGAGYLWNLDQLKASGLTIVRDEHEAIDSEGVGGPAIRRIAAILPETFCGSVSLDERRPWDPVSPLTHFALNADMTGPEIEGLSRAERRSLLAAA